MFSNTKKTIIFMMTIILTLVGIVSCGNSNNLSTIESDIFSGDENSSIEISSSNEEVSSEIVLSSEMISSDDYSNINMSLEIGDFQYKIDKGVVSVVGYLGENKNIIIPSTIEISFSNETLLEEKKIELKVTKLN